MAHDHDWKGTLGAFVLFGALVLTGVLAAYAAVEDYTNARASLRWPSVEGVVLSQPSNQDGLRYAWFDGSTSHTGERVRFRSAALRDSGVVYEPGRKITVYLSPENGALAVLEPGGSAGLFAVTLAFGALLVFVGLAGIIRLAMLVDGLSPAPRDPDYGIAAAHVAE
jgi:hypothetical protein